MHKLCKLGMFGMFGIISYQGGKFKEKYYPNEPLYFAILDVILVNDY